MTLAKYKAKRNLSKTPEPDGGKASQGQLRFVIQKHAASRLHYDFRLEMEGVLKSWAIPKGPSLNPAHKRLAMMVEDHPMDYRLFEGVIPPGNYGAGSVIVWDEGAYTDYDESDDPKKAHINLKAGLKKGDLKFILRGSKVQGAFALVKIKGDDKNAWLLIKKEDAYSSPTDITKLDTSVLSGNTLESTVEMRNNTTDNIEYELADTPRADQPDFVKPMLAVATVSPFQFSDWLSEIKWDGYRIMAHKKAENIKLNSRNNKDYSQAFAPIQDELQGIAVDCVLDGEMVVLDKAGRSDFGGLQNYLSTGEGELYYYVFDIPFAAGRDLRRLPLVRRKEIAKKIISPLHRVRFSDHVAGRGLDFFEAAQQMRVEGVVMKDMNSPYQDGKRAQTWRKIKTHMRQEAVIAGFTQPRGSRQHIGALVLGTYSAGKLIYIGHAGTGMGSRVLKEVYRSLKPLERKTSPFLVPPKTNAPVKWVSPKLVAEIEFSDWTRDGSMRHPIFLGLRKDKDASKVTREVAVDPPSTKERTMKPNHHTVEITNSDKVFWPEEGYTKGDVAEYYHHVSGIILPYLIGRPESLNRHPNGITGKNFFQKDLESHPEWVKTVPIFSESNQEDINWLLCQDEATLMYMVNLGCIELNPWLSRVHSLEKPDFCLLDLDAKSSPFENVIDAARECHKLCLELGIPSYPKTSGKTGMHICIPLGAKYTFEQSRQFAEILMRNLHERLPKTTSVERTPTKRKRKIYLDYLQNRKGQTMAAPYSVRPVPGATVSTPLKWSEVNQGLNPAKFTIKTTKSRFKKMGDLWAGILDEPIDMADVLKKL